MNLIRTSSSSNFTPYLLSQIISFDATESEQNVLINSLSDHPKTLVDFRKWVDYNYTLVNQSAVLRNLVRQIKSAERWNMSVQSSNTHATALIRFGAHQLQQSLSHLFSEPNNPTSPSIDKLVYTLRTTPPSELSKALSEYLIIDESALKNIVVDLLRCIKSQIFNHLLVYDSKTLRSLLTYFCEVRPILISQNENFLAAGVVFGVITLLCTNRRIRPNQVDSPLNDPEIFKTVEPIFYLLTVSGNSILHVRFIELIRLQSELCSHEGFANLIHSLFPLMTTLSKHEDRNYQFLIYQIIRFTNHLEKEYRTSIFILMLPLLLELAEINPEVVYEIISLQDKNKNTFLHLDANLFKSKDLILCLAKKGAFYITELFSIKNENGISPVTLDFMFRSPFLPQLNKINSALVQTMTPFIDEIFEEIIFDRKKRAISCISDLTRKNRNQLLELLSFYPQLFHKNYMVKGSKDLLDHLLQSSDDSDIDLFFKIFSARNIKGQCSLHFHNNFLFVAGYLTLLTNVANRKSILDKLKDFLAIQDENGNTIIHAALLNKNKEEIYTPQCLYRSKFKSWSQELGRV